MAEGLADFGQTLISFAKLRKRVEFARVATALPSTGHVSVFLNWKLLFTRMNLKPADLKNFVFDSKMCLRVCEVYRFQNLVGLELPIKHKLRVNRIIELRVNSLILFFRIDAVNPCK